MFKRLYYRLKWRLMRPPAKYEKCEICDRVFMILSLETGKLVQGKSRFPRCAHCAKV